MTKSSSPTSDPMKRPARRLVVAPLLARQSLGEAYHVLTFDVPGGMTVSPGQFAMVRGANWGESPLLPRPMSFLGGGAPSILIKVVGEGTARMARATPGEPFSLLGPLGNGWHPLPAGRRPVLVAGGVGVAPLLFLARSLAATGARPLCLFGGRSSRDLPLADALSEVTELALATEDGSRGERGRVTELLERALTPEVAVFTCGPDRMMARVAELCAERGVPCEVSLETPMACGYGVCLGCPKPLAGGGYLYACTEGPCVDAQRLDFSEPSTSGRPA